MYMSEVNDLRWYPCTGGRLVVVVTCWSEAPPHQERDIFGYNFWSCPGLSYANKRGVSSVYMIENMLLILNNHDNVILSVYNT